MPKAESKRRGERGKWIGLAALAVFSLGVGIAIWGEPGAQSIDIKRLGGISGIDSPIIAQARLPQQQAVPPRLRAAFMPKLVPSALPTAAGDARVILLDLKLIGASEDGLEVPLDPNPSPALRENVRQLLVQFPIRATLDIAGADSGPPVKQVQPDGQGNGTAGWSVGFKDAGSYEGVVTLVPSNARASDVTLESNRIKFEFQVSGRISWTRIIGLCVSAAGGAALVMMLRRSSTGGNDAARILPANPIGARKHEAGSSGGTDAPARGVTGDGMSHPKDPSVFLSYSHEDQEVLERLLQHLKPLNDGKLLDCWSDRSIRAGAQWRPEIERVLASARVAVLLVSPSFLASDFISKHELPTLLDSAVRDGLTIIWVPVRASNYRHTPIARYQAAHDPANPLAGLAPSQVDEALVKICDQVLEAATHRGQSLQGSET